MQRNFSSSIAAFAVFPLTGRDPLFVLRYCFLNVLFFAIVFAAAAYGGLIEAFTNFAASASSGAAADPSEILALYAKMGPGLVTIGVLACIFGLMMTTMALRKLVRDEEAGLLGLQVGGDEWRLFLAYLGLIGLSLAITVVFSLVVGILIAGLSFAIGGDGGLGASLIAIPIILAVYLGIAYVAMRFCQFGVMTIANKRVGVFQSWNETKGNFWRYFGAYLLWALVAFIGGIVIQSVLMIILGFLSGAGLGGGSPTGAPADLAQMLSVAGLIYILVNGFVSGFAQLGYLAVGASAWQQKYGGVTSDIDAF
jgi:hypothetical protein